MSTSGQTTRQDQQTAGVAGFLRNTFQAALGVAENMHQSAIEIPLSMVPKSVASEEQTTALKDKHRNLLRGMYGSVDSLVTKAMGVGAEQAGRLAEGIRDLADDIQDDDSPVESDEVKAESDANAEIASKS